MEAIVLSSRESTSTVDEVSRIEWGRERPARIKRPLTGAFNLVC